MKVIKKHFESYYPSHAFIHFHQIILGIVLHLKLFTPRGTKWLLGAFIYPIQLFNLPWMATGVLYLAVTFKDLTPTFDKQNGKLVSYDFAYKGQCERQGCHPFCNPVDSARFLHLFCLLGVLAKEVEAEYTDGRI